MVPTVHITRNLSISLDPGGGSWATTLTVKYCTESYCDYKLVPILSSKIKRASMKSAIDESTSQFYVPS